MKKWNPVFKIVAILLLINLLGSKVYFRKDLTSDKRYTLSKVTENELKKLKNVVQVTIYLKGDFPLDFKRLESAVEQHLQELKAHNSKIHYRFEEPSGMEEKLVKKGMQPSSLTVEEDGEVSEKLIFPYAVLKYDSKEAVVPLLLSSSEGQEKQLQRSIENLEYAFTNAIDKLTSKKQKSVAVLRSHGTLEDVYLYDFLSSVKEKYNLAPFILQPEGVNPEKVTKDLQQYDALIIPKPTKAFSDQDKYILDQYIMNGGKTLWLVDQVVAEMDSLQQNGEAMFIPRDLSLTDLFFAYGVRINFDLVQDLYSSKIAVATGNMGNQTQFQQFLWQYYPLVSPNQNHQISKNIEPVNLKFPSGMDTLKNTIRKTILLQSSKLTKISGLPTVVSLMSLADKIDPTQFQAPQQNMGVLLEGKFSSAYAFRTKPFSIKEIKESPENKMIVISDGDIVVNPIQDGQPASMETDKWTGQYFGNKAFLLNCVDYLLDNSGLLELRGKTLDIKMLDKQKVLEDRGFWQMVNIILPLILLLSFGFIYTWLRKRKYTN